MLDLTPSSCPPRVTRSAASAYRNALFDRVFNSPPVYDTLFDCCVGTATIACLSAARRGARLAFLAYMARNWHKHLSRFVDPWTFCSFQAHNGFLVSGSLALQLFLETDFGSDMDLYPWPGKERELGNFIIAQGYRLQLEDWGTYKAFSDIMDHVDQYGWISAVASAPIGLMNAYRGCPHVAGILCFVKDGPSSDHVLQIHLIASDISPVITILGFHSTVVLNFITSDSAVSLFPGLTLGERTMCALRQNATPNSEVITKYKSRGFTERHTLPMDTAVATEDADKKTLSMRRWVGDKYTWTIALSTSDVELPEEPPVDVTLYGFTLSQPTAASVVDVDSDTDTPIPLVNIAVPSVQLRFDQETFVNESEDIRSDAGRQYTVPYSVPLDFKVTLKTLRETAKQLQCSCSNLYFNVRDATGRDGELRKRKLAYQRYHDGQLGSSQQHLHHLKHCKPSTRSPYSKRQVNTRKLAKLK